jgi:hypothetical protein
MASACYFHGFGKNQRVNEKFQSACRRFDAENSRDPNQESGRPRELLYAARLTDWALKLCPDAAEPLRLAARGRKVWWIFCGAGSMANRSPVAI